MSEIVLTGIKGDIPIGAMAAFGLFRIMNSVRLQGETRLSWEPHGSSWRPILSTGGNVSEEGVIEDLVAYLRTHPERREFGWHREIKSATAEQFTAAARPAIGEAQSTGHELADWFSSFANELITKEEALEPTPFDMTVAQQRFLTDSNRLASKLAGDDNVSACLREALFGPWKYKDEQHSLGWDPSTMLLGAFTVKKPEKMKKWGVPAAVWLATESLPLFPCFCTNSKLATRAFHSERRIEEFCWPVWRRPISLAVLKSLFASPDLIDADKLKTLRGRGVDGVFRSRKFKPNKYMVSFQPAVFSA
jgi:hypothetical protein